jgi:gamma-glutamyltranspeptidase/glutathione hydrolase
LQVLLNRLVFGLELQEAVDRPRLHLEGDTLYLEPGLGKEFETLMDELYAVVRFRKKSLFFGGVQAVAPPFGEGGGDKRRGGVVLVF